MNGENLCTGFISFCHKNGGYIKIDNSEDNFVSFDEKDFITPGWTFRRIFEGMRVQFSINNNGGRQAVKIKKIKGGEK